MSSAFHPYARELRPFWAPSNDCSLYVPPWIRVEGAVVHPCTTIGALIRDRRQTLGWTQEYLAVKIDDGMTQSDVSRLERGKIGLPRRRRLERLAQVLDLPLGELLAQSGWADADRHFGSTAEQIPTPQAPDILAPGDDPRRTESKSAFDRLHAALGNSRAISERTSQLLARSQATMCDWDDCYHVPSPDGAPSLRKWFDE